MKITLKIRVFALVSILVVSSTLVLSYILLNDLKDGLQEGFESRGSIIVNYFALETVEGIIIEDEDGLARVAERLLESKDVVYANIFDAEGTRIVSKATLPAGEFSTGQLALNTSVVEIEHILAGPDSNIPVLDFRAPALDEYGERIGCVQMGLSLESIEAQTQRMAARSLLLLTIFVAIGSVASFLVANSIANPIKALTRVFTVIAGGDLDQEIDTSRKDELGSLSVSFAAMRDSIRHKLQLLENEALVRKQAEQELERHRDNLEGLIRERTVELANANMELKAEVTERQQAQEDLKQSLDELARHNDAMTGREKKILELKAQVNSLLEELGQERAFGTTTESTKEPDDPHDAAESQAKRRTL